MKTVEGKKKNKSAYKTKENGMNGEKLRNVRGSVGQRCVKVAKKHVGGCGGGSDGVSNVTGDKKGKL